MYRYLFGTGTHHKHSKFINVGDTGSQTFSGTKFFQYRFRDFFRNQFFPIPVLILFSDNDSETIPGTGTSHSGFHAVTCANLAFIKSQTMIKFFLNCWAFSFGQTPFFIFITSFHLFIHAVPIRSKHSFAWVMDWWLCCSSQIKVESNLIPPRGVSSNKFKSN